MSSCVRACGRILESIRIYYKGIFCLRLPRLWNVPAARVQPCCKGLAAQTLSTGIAQTMVGLLDWHMTKKILLWKKKKHRGENGICYGIFMGFICDIWVFHCKALWFPFARCERQHKSMFWLIFQQVAHLELSSNLLGFPVLCVLLFFFSYKWVRLIIHIFFFIIKMYFFSKFWTMSHAFLSQLLFAF